MCLGKLRACVETYARLTTFVQIGPEAALTALTWQYHMTASKVCSTCSTVHIWYPHMVPACAK